MSHLKIMTSQRRIPMADTVTEAFTILTFYLYCEIMLAVIHARRCGHPALSGEENCVL